MFALIQDVAKTPGLDYGGCGKICTQGARQGGTKLRYSSSARLIRGDQCDRAEDFKFRSQKHCRSTNTKNSVSTKFTIAVGWCLKQWSRVQWVLSVLKQSFSMSQRPCPASQRRRLES